jgi:DnaB-like helicase N terminal domain/AAA domain
LLRSLDIALRADVQHLPLRRRGDRVASGSPPVNPDAPALGNFCGDGNVDLDEKFSKVDSPKWNKSHTSFTATCPGSHNGTTHQIAVSESRTACLGSPRCSEELIAKFFANGNGARQSEPKSSVDRRIERAPAGVAEQSKVQRPPKQSSQSQTDNLPARANTDDILRRSPPQNLEAEQSVLGAVLLENESIEEANRVVVAEDFYRESHREIFKAMQQLWRDKVPIDAITLTAELTRRRRLEQIGGPAYLAELASVVPTARNIAHYSNIVKSKAVTRNIATRATQIATLAYDGVSSDALVGEAGRLLNPLIEAGSGIREAIPWEGFDAAVTANDEYLKRLPVIDKLCYSNAVSMITGGKHAGKSTLARWMAVCVAKGWEFLKRETRQGPVFYIASEDETMAARQELIRLGWKQGDELRFLSAQNIRSDKPEIFLADLTMEIKRARAKLVILDMLFDFVRIDDEMSYAGTREAVGRIQEVASMSGAHIVAIHHAPKNANIGDAAVAALGSQGLAARVSPIILVRRFGPGVHSVSSTGVRDPRGESISDSRLIKNADGSVELGGAFKNYMLAEVYMGRVKEMLEDDPGSEMTAPEISEALTITYEVARSCLSNMFKNQMVHRTGSGKKGQPYRYSIPISGSNGSKQADPNSTFPTVPPNSGERGNSTVDSEPEIQKPFAYKDD